MAKRRDMLEQLAQRRKNKVPIRIAKAVKTLTVRMVAVQDVHNRKDDGTQGAVKKVTSALITEVTMQGLREPISCRVAVDVDQNYNATDELEKSFKWAFNETINFIVLEYCKRVAQKEADRKAESGEEPEEVVSEPVVAPPKKEVAKDAS